MTRTAGSLACAALVLTFAAARPAVVVSGQADAQADKGEQIQNAQCISCHDLRPIQTQALDKDGWTKVIASMVEKGAEVKAEDTPALVVYLVKNHGPLPDGRERRCSSTPAPCVTISAGAAPGGTRDD